MSIEEVSSELSRLTDILGELYAEVQRRRNAIECVCGDCRQLMQPWPKNCNPLPVVNKKPEQVAKNPDPILKAKAVEEAAAADVALTRAERIRRRYQQEVSCVNEQSYAGVRSHQGQSESVATANQVKSDEITVIPSSNSLIKPNSRENSRLKISNVAFMSKSHSLSNSAGSQSLSKVINNHRDQVKRPISSQSGRVKLDAAEPAVIDKSSLDQILSYTQDLSSNANKSSNSNRTLSNAVDKSGRGSRNQVSSSGSFSSVNKARSAKPSSNVSRTSGVAGQQQTKKSYIPAHMKAPFKTVPHLQQSRRIEKSSTARQPGRTAVERSCSSRLSNGSPRSYISTEPNQCGESNPAKSVISDDDLNMIYGVGIETGSESKNLISKNPAESAVTRFEMSSSSSQKYSAINDAGNINLEDLLYNLHASSKDDEYPGSIEAGSISSRSISATQGDCELSDSNQRLYSRALAAKNLEPAVTDDIRTGNEAIEETCSGEEEENKSYDGRFVLSQHGVRLKLPANIQRCKATNERLRQDILHSLVTTATTSSKEQRSSVRDDKRKSPGEKFLKLLQARNKQRRIIGEDPKSYSQSDEFEEIKKIKALCDLCHWLTSLLHRVQQLNISDRSSWQEVLTARTCVEYVLREFTIIRQAYASIDNFDLTVPSTLNESVKSKLLDELSIEEDSICGRTLWYRTRSQIDRYWVQAFRVEKLRIRNYILCHVAPKVLKLLRCLNPNDKLYSEACRLVYSFVTSSGTSFPVILKDCDEDL